MKIVRNGKTSGAAEGEQEHERQKIWKWLKASSNYHSRSLLTSCNHLNLIEKHLKLGLSAWLVLVLVRVCDLSQSLRVPQCLGRQRTGLGQGGSRRFETCGYLSSLSLLSPQPHSHLTTQQGWSYSNIILWVWCTKIFV